jgi:LytS/YehU family sensor histidine kinase
MLDEGFTTKFLPRISGRGIEASPPSCQRPRMSQRTRYTQAAGSVLAISIIAGAVAGVIVGQPSIGFLVGLAAGVLLAILFWLNDRRR